VTDLISSLDVDVDLALNTSVLLASEMVSHRDLDRLLQARLLLFMNRILRQCHTDHQLAPEIIQHAAKWVVDPISYPSEPYERKRRDGEIEAEISDEQTVASSETPPSDQQPDGEPEATVEQHLEEEPDSQQPPDVPDEQVSAARRGQGRRGRFSMDRPPRRGQRPPILFDDQHPPVVPTASLSPRRDSRGANFDVFEFN
jgi:hypothetical protein